MINPMVRAMIVKPGWLIVGIVLALAVPTRGENLLKNPGFEEDGGWTAYMLASLRSQWRSHDEGQYNAAILGLWADKDVGGIIDRALWADRGPNGMIEQRNIPVTPGNSYVFKAWLWADQGWLPQEQYMKITFHDKNGVILAEESIELPIMHPIWTSVLCEAKAPSGAATASVSIGARGVSSYGALTIDDASFEETP